MTKVKRCVGAVIYNDEGKIFLMTSHKWPGKYIIPGGQVEDGETDEEALHREMKEETGMDVDRVHFVGEKAKAASADFHKSDVTFQFVDYFVHAATTDVTPNHEVTTYDWFTIEEAQSLPLLDSTEQLIQQFAVWAKDNI